MIKIKIGVILGGMSTENEVSIISGSSVIEHLNKEKYDINPIYISKDGDWFKVKLEDIQKKDNNGNFVTKFKIMNVMEYLKNMDIIFPVLHGLYGEDGSMQGLFELLKIPYVGCKVLASSLGMDKVYTKIIFKKAGLNVADSMYIRKNNDKYIYIDEKFDETILDIDEISKIAEKKLKYPIFVKPSNQGSSVGINKAHNKKELQKAIIEASKFDRKILLEETIIGREVECAVLGNEEVITSCVGEIKAADEFYSYDAKYRNDKSKTIIPANISDELSKKIRESAVKAFKAIDGKGLSRVDFFIQDETQKIFINEVNTLPGFTSISMYPKLFEASGISYSDLLDKAINLAKEN